MMTVAGFRRARHGIGTEQPFPEFERDVLIDRTGMRFLLLHAQFGQHFDDYAGFHFKLPRQLVDSDFLHRKNYFYVIAGRHCACPPSIACRCRSKKGPLSGIGSLSG
jgi:hypothetical protein